VYTRADSVIVLAYRKITGLSRVLRRSGRLHAARRAEGEAVSARPELVGKTLVHLSSPAQARAWLHRLSR